MKVSQAINFKSLFTLRTLAMLVIVATMAMSASAQRIRGSLVKIETPSAPAANPNLDQCANGQQAAAPPTTLLPCTGSNWQNGNLNTNNSQYVEGQAVTYRAIMTGTGSGSLTIQYDATKSGKHALDYLTTYTYTNSTGNDPCNHGNQAPYCNGTFTQFPI